MKTWQIVLVGLAAASIAGCQADPNIALLERDLRRQEDEIYRLRDQLEDCQAELQAARRCRAAVARRAGGDSFAGNAGGRRTGAAGCPSARPTRAERTGSRPLEDAGGPARCAAAIAWRARPAQLGCPAF